MKHTPPRQRRLGSVAALALACTLFFAAAGPAHADSGAVGPPILGLKWSTVPAVSCDGQDVRLLFTVCECKVDLVAAGFDRVGPIVVRLRVQPDIVCATCHPDTHAVDVGRLRAGSHEFTVRVDIEYVTPPDSSWPTSPVFGVAVFQVAPACATPTGIPYLDHVIIGNHPRCPECPSRVCPGDSIDVHLSGTFPDDCTTLAGVELISSRSASPLPWPPTVRVTYGINSCLGRPCSLVPVPWRAQVRMPGLP
ncbi:MAG: hypothetical protein ABIP29_01800, partial [Candidatus Eisenbacteria bacterium]